MKRFSTLLLAVGLAIGGNLALASAEPQATGSVLVIGHKNPDTDSIVAAIAVAHLKNLQGIAAVAVAQGPANPETQFVLETFHLTAPRVETSVAGRKVILVDHSDYPQAPADLAKAEIVGLIDHHKLGGLATDKPLEAWVFPVGSTSTIIARMYATAGVPIPKAIAGGMLCAILSDTVIFKSPTTTPEDRATATRLAKVAGIKDPEALGLKLFEVKSQLKGVPAAELLKRDFKTFVMNGRKVGVGQLEVVDLAILTPMKKDLLQAMVDLKAENYHSLFLMLTDITKEGTELLLLSDDLAIVASAFGAKPQGSSMWLPGVMSRKKQVIPGLEQAFK
ncbi:MAG: manganese-dependent inorganic pyrophosphatase [Holophagaceae bacterium]|jgi:manganese-dependent inorganic pyrophosphatase|uniref:inorganic diphosphatase n=1 Tax=Candidatus Geothrix odensensis TaxID=2954440 RepID=A0A936F4S1_9BACT|nr:manganese-dependent inorganic pyrophosphatase [Candidatus Geothrix odensensis]MBK8791290.1 manganese-dependent inorganic pyrophosphatase [Holophagaceae bacterium]